MSDAETEIKVIKIAKVISEVISEHFGHKVESTIDMKNISERGRGVYFKMDIAQSFGVFNMIIKNAHFSVTIEDTKDGNYVLTRVKVDLDYNYPGGGSKGNEIMRLWLDNKFKVLEKRFSKN